MTADKVTSSDLPDSVTLKNGMKIQFHDKDWVITCTVPASESLFVPEHYHLIHDEFHKVHQGFLHLTMDGVTQRITPESGEVKIPKGVRHSLEKKKGDPILIMSERTGNLETNADKEYFFRNFFDPVHPGHPLQALAASWENDIIFSVPGHITALETRLLTVLGGYFAFYLGFRKRISKEQILKWHASKTQ